MMKMMNTDNKSIDQRSDEFFEGLPCHVQTPYPSAHVNVKNKQLANTLLNAYADGGASEITAITQYLDHSKTIEDEAIADQVLCMALVEMHHLDMIGTLIQSLGGELRYWKANHGYWNADQVDYGNSTCEKLSLDILSEQEAIRGYQQILREIHRMNDQSMRPVIAVIERILEDEELHLNTFIDLYHKSCAKEAEHHA